MSHSDPIADMLTRIRNANRARQPSVDVPHSVLKGEVARLLKREGYLKDFTVEGEGARRVLRVSLKYGADEAPVLRGLRRISRPGRRSYVDRTALPRVLNGIGVAILTTSRGVMTDREARRAKIGGEVICEAW